LVPTSNFRFTGQASTENPAFGKQLGSSGSMNCAIDPSTAEKRRVRRVYYRIDVKFSDIALDDLDLVRFFLHHGARRSISQLPSVARV
jgi:hypothetical protein